MPQVRTDFPINGRPRPTNSRVYTRPKLGRWRRLRRALGVFAEAVGYGFGIGLGAVLAALVAAVLILGAALLALIVTFIIGGS